VLSTKSSRHPRRSIEPQEPPTSVVRYLHQRFALSERGSVCVDACTLDSRVGTDGVLDQGDRVGDICRVRDVDFDPLRGGSPRLKPTVERALQLQLSDHFFGQSKVHSRVAVEVRNLPPSTGIGNSVPVPRFGWYDPEDLDQPTLQFLTGAHNQAKL
jgi:hypothetical protein